MINVPSDNTAPVPEPEPEPEPVVDGTSEETPESKPKETLVSDATYLVSLAKSYGHSKLGHDAMVQALETILKAL